jgi:hypothetical protein
MGKSTIDPAQAGAATSGFGTPIALADPQSALAQFQQAANVIEQQYPGALSAYQGYVERGQKGALDAQSQALISNLPVSDTATAALGELRGYLGLPAISPTAGLSTQMGNIANRLNVAGAPPELSSQLTVMQDQLRQAEDLSDPTDREAMKQQVMDSFGSFNQQASAQLGGMWDQFSPEMENIANQFTAGYGREESAAWSPETIQAKLEATPGYQFQFGQGMKALERSAAARGNLMSGGTLAAAQEFGQGLASQTYGQQIDRLQRAVGTAAPSIGQQAGLLQGTGQMLGQYGQAMGGAAGDISQNIANAAQQAALMSGQGLLQSTAQQAGLSQQGEMANLANIQQTALANAQLRQQAALSNQQVDAKTGGLLTQLISR